MQSNNPLGLASLRGVFWCVGSVPVRPGARPAYGLVLYGIISRDIIYSMFATHVTNDVSRVCTCKYIPTRRLIVK